MKIFRKNDDTFAGSIMGIKGMYKNAIFRLEKDEIVTIGRCPKSSQIVMDETYKHISRIHCKIQSNIITRNYTVTDLSSNGTFVNGERLPKNTAVNLPKGTVISIGDSSNTFKLN